MNRHTRSARNAPPPRKSHNGILLAAVIILMASLNLYAILGRDALSWDSAPAPYEPSYSDPAPIETVSLSDVPAQLSCGQQMQCSVTGAYDDVVWSSSDSAVISVENGSLTALQAGTAIITAENPVTGVSDSAEVTVLDDWRENTTAALEHLIASGSDVNAAPALRLQHQRLSRCADPEAVQLYQALDSLVSFADGGEACDFDQLAAALSADADDLRFAAECLHMYGQTSDNTVTMTFTGDCTFGYLNDNNAANRFPAVYRKSGSVTYPFDRVRHIFAADDLTVINYEATLADKGSKEADKKYHFRGEPEYVDILTQSSVEVANLANNHTLDYKQAGLDRTVELLSAGGVSTLTTETPVVTEIKGIEVVLIGAGHWKFPTEIDDAVEAMSSQIAQYKKPDNLVIVNLHWGGEYVTAPTKKQIKAAHSLIDQGADMIVSHHAHIIQGIEVYNGKVIAYGLGNFSFGGTSTLEEKESFILRATFGRNEDGSTAMTRWSVIPCYASSTGKLSNNFQPMPLHGKDARSMMSVLAKRSKQIDGCKEFPYFYYE